MRSANWFPSVMRNRNLSAKLPATIVCAACALLISPSAAKAYRQLEAECNGKMIPLAWKQPCISYAVAPRVLIDPETGKELGPNNDPPMEQVREMINSSFDAWTSVECDGRSIGFQVEQLEADSECAIPQQNATEPNVNVVAFIWDWQERHYDEDAMAFTAVWYDPTCSGEILGADMMINETVGGLGDCCPDGECSVQDVFSCKKQNIVDIQNVVTHEAGHFLGMGESENESATMYPNAEMGDINKRYLTNDDRAGFCNIYPASSLSEKCDYTPRNGLSLSCYEPSSGYSNSCGCKIAGGNSDGASGPAALCLLGLTIGAARRRRRAQNRRNCL